MTHCSMMQVLCDGLMLGGRENTLNKGPCPRWDCGNLPQAPGSVYRAEEKTKYKLSS